ncbi:SEC-C motif-containing protein [Salegentibacter sp. 24]|uniref:DUF1186 domain-containing protein n=1 Tax=Salegentibacter sp. 24 TaxID=2183986 RepID=UPI0010D62142|nr:DUF1186 domain-containing protein [Salegentibacter sp. 24]TDN78458.1 SEC-C motif-containing protein [Salegentibacter sp. 24]
MGQDGLKLKNYKITGDDTILDEQNQITPEVRRIIEELRPDVEKGRKYLIKKLNSLSRKYPKTPVFKNFLSVVYQKNGNVKQAYAVNRWIVKEHPNYLSGKINLAIEFLFKGQSEEIPGIFGESMEIGELYPERKEFHFEEVIGFHTVSVQYFLTMDEIEQAELRVKLLEDLDSQHPKAQYAREILREWYMTKASERKERERLQRKEVLLKDTRSHLQTTKSPNFHFEKEINWLYQNGLSIDRKKIEQILTIDSSELIEDLEKVLQDSIARFDFFVGKVNAEGYNNKKLAFPIHAILLLAHFKKKDSFPAILQILKQDRDFIDFWFGDFIADIMDVSLNNCGKDQIHRMFEFLKLPNIDTSSKCILGESLVKIINNSNEEKADLTEEYRQVLNLYIENAENENFADTEAVGFIISDIMDLAYAGLLPEIKQLFDLKLVDTSICGNFKEVATEIAGIPVEKNMGFIVKDIYEQYEELGGYENENNNLEINEDLASEIYNEWSISTFDNEPIVNSKKPGRNDPCLCGSGKKYKKCCMNN